MAFRPRIAIAVAALLIALLGAGATALAQKHGGTLRIHNPESIASLSMLEEFANAQLPIMGMFNNLVMFDQHVAQNSLQSIVPDLATSWSWNEEGTDLAFQLRQGVSWHDGKPFTAQDVKCTWDLYLETGPEKLRINPRKSSYYNLAGVSTNGDYEVTFHLKRPQPAFPMLLASGFSVIFPCHVPPREMRQHPIGTGPFKLADFKSKEYVRVTRNPDYWKPGRPFLDGIEHTIIPDPATAVLAFTAGKFDMTAPGQLTVPLMNDIKGQVPQSICDWTPGNLNRHMLVNREKPPFDNPDLRRALALSIDRQAFVDIIGQGQGQIGGVLQPSPEGVWGMPLEMVKQLPGYGPDVLHNRAEARRIMDKLGYGRDRQLNIKVTSQDWAIYRDPAVLLTDQLKQVYIDGELDLVETAQYYPKILRGDYSIALNLQTSGPDPDPILHVFYGCGASLNWSRYCNPAVDELIERQSREADPNRRRAALWEIERELAADHARPIIFYRNGGTCRQPYVKGLTLMVNSPFNGWRMEDVWLDK
jgi:peptide/nickel transport system substrate-binding protein